MDLAKVAQMVNVLNRLTARDALCMLVGCTLAVLDEAPSDEERQQSLDNCIIDALRVAMTHVAKTSVMQARCLTLKVVARAEAPRL